jgi:hypothetical protein
MRRTTDVLQYAPMVSSRCGRQESAKMFLAIGMILPFGCFFPFTPLVAMPSTKNVPKGKINTGLKDVGGGRHLRP